MNAAKLDPLLAAILRSDAAGAGAQPHTVLVRLAVDPADEQWRVLARHGVARGARPSRTLSARLGRASIAALSEDGWIESIRLAPASRPLAGPAG